MSSKDTTTMTKFERFKEFFGCKPMGQRGFDGASNTDRCIRCHRRILQDSQGGWFPASIQDTAALDGVLGEQE